MKGRLGGRTHEISRLIGRSLRAAIDLKVLGENTIAIDCDVLQADGGTRTAAVTGALVALTDACRHLQRPGAVVRPLAAVSVGIVDGEPRLDLEYVEDVKAGTDMNVVATADGELVEVQGTAEGAPFRRDELDALLDLALAASPTSPGCRPTRSRSRCRPATREARRPCERSRPAVPRRERGVARGASGGRTVTVVVLATANPGKVVELRRILGAVRAGAASGIDGAYEPGPETGATFEDNALAKAREAVRHTGLPAVADDSGLAVDALNGMPGVLSARWAGPARRRPRQPRAAARPASATCPTSGGAPRSSAPRRTRCPTGGRASCAGSCAAR